MLRDLLWAGIGAIVMLVVVVWGYCEYRRRQRQHLALPIPRSWYVSTTAGDGYHYDKNWTEGAVVVRVQPVEGRGRGFIVGKAYPTSENFEDEIAELQSQAEDQADRLHATGTL